MEPWLVVMLVWLVDWTGPLWEFLSPMKVDGLMRLDCAFVFIAAGWKLFVTSLGALPGVVSAPGLGLSRVVTTFPGGMFGFVFPGGTPSGVSYD